MIIASILFLASCSQEKNEKDPEASEEALKNLNESGMPIVKEPITVDFFVGTSSTTAQSDWNDILIWNKYAEMTNMEVNWNQISEDALEEKRNLALASGDLPDVFYAAQLSGLDILKYGEQGTFIKLNDLIDKYAPNLKELMKENPEIEKAMTFPDGNIYSMPNIYSPDFLSLRIGATPWINREWLDTLKMDMPETTDEFYQYLKAVKEQDPNGNGKHDEIPFGGPNINELIGWVQGSFGINNRADKYVDMDPNTDKMRFIPTSDGYKEMLTYVNKLYSEKLIEQNIFSIDWSQFLANGSEGKYGSTVFWTPADTFANEAGKAYESAVALKGPNGDQLFTSVLPSIAGTGEFVITNENKNPAATVKWMDYFYSDEGAKLFYMGVEGETYEETADGKYEYLDKIVNNPEGLTLNQEIGKYLTWGGTFSPGIIKEEYFAGSESSPLAIEAAEKLKPNVPEEIWAGFTYTADENKVLSALGADIEKYVAEMRDKFITGDVPLSEWDDYVETIEKMGLEEYMNIQKEAYKRYQES